MHSNYVDDGKISDNVLLWTTVENNPKLWKILNFNQKKELLKSFPIYLKKSINLWISGKGNLEDSNSIYRRSAFNKYGDIGKGKIGNYEFNENNGGTVPDITPNVAKRLNELNIYLKERGATLLVAAYPICSGEFSPKKEEYEKFQKKLESNLDFPVISNFTDYMYDYKYFYNSSMHLTDEGAIIRTNQLIKDLDKYLKNKK